MNKTLFLLRGLPGSGKSTFGRIVWSAGVIFEADKYFEDIDGNYKFDPSKIKDAHAWCKQQVEDAMKLNDAMGYENHPFPYFNEIVVSNTFTQEWELKDYFDLASKYNYKVVSLIVENRHGSNSIHDVPSETIEKMRKRFEIKL